MTVTLDAAALGDAFVYTFPLYEMARTRYAAVDWAMNPRRGAANRFTHGRVLADDRARGVTTPNNDTLYSSAWLDLSAGPIELTVPRIAGRYWSLQFIDAYTNNAEVIGSRNAGDGALSLWIAHVDDAAKPPAGMRELRLPTRDVWLLSRIVVDGIDDLPAVHALQDQLTLRAPDVPAAPRPVVTTPRGSTVDGVNYLAVVNDMLARNGAPSAERARIAGWAPLGIGAVPSPEQGAAWGQALPALYPAITGGLERGGRMVGGWRYPNAAVGVFGSDYWLRAAVALGGLAALPQTEALYLSAPNDSKGRPLDSSHRYRVRMPAAGLPVDAFWSLSMYQAEPDGRLFFTPNPVHRFAIGDRTRGLRKRDDGSIEIVIRRDEPADAAERANWLPAPAGDIKTFRLVLRAYLPKPALLGGEAALPVVERED